VRKAAIIFGIVFAVIGLIVAICGFTVPIYGSPSRALQVGGVVMIIGALVIAIQGAAAKKP
jgi:uncharacterized membrane protein